MLWVAFILVLSALCIKIIDSMSTVLKPAKLLVLGGTGFVGHQIVQQICEKYPTDYSITSISRRGILKDERYKDEVNWISGDANEIIDDVISKYGPFDICIHCIGLLLDKDSGLSGLNRLASGSGSQPDEKSTYDYVTRQTAINAINYMKRNQNRNARLPTFIFISAAEAGWTVRPPIDWLSRYLDAKQAVERELKQSRDKLRPVIFRPSLIWSMERPQALLSVAPFYVGSILGLPFVDRPVLVQSLVAAIIESCSNQDVSGLQRYKEIDLLAAKQAVKNINKNI